jgi:hypothetical protein
MVYTRGLAAVPTAVAAAALGDGLLCILKVVTNGIDDKDGNRQRIQDTTIQLQVLNYSSLLRK